MTAESHQQKKAVPNLSMPHQTNPYHQYGTSRLGMSTGILRANVSWQQLLDLADPGLYQAQDKHRNCYLSLSSARKVGLEDKIRHAVSSSL
jgi:PleD family two-component response regulator